MIVYSIAMPVAMRSKAEVCGRSLAGIVGSNPICGSDVSLVIFLCVVSGLCVGPITFPESSCRVSRL